MTTRERRPFLMEAGEPSFLGCDAIELCSRAADLFDQAQDNDSAGFELDQLVLCPIVSLPVPNAASAKPRWEGVNPALLWNPLFWLPEQLAQPEPDEHPFYWAARVMIDLEDSGLWSRDAGFVDVLAAIGIDTSDAAALERVRAWQTGAPDAQLDELDLSALFSEPAALAEQTTKVMAVMLPVGLGKHAAHLTWTTEEAIDEEAFDAAPEAAAVAFVALSHSSPAVLLELASLVERSLDEAQAKQVLIDLLGVCATVEIEYREVADRFDLEVLASAV